MTKVLFVVSAADGWELKDGTVHPTGVWAEELAEPHRIFSEQGWDITLATPGGVAPTIDQLSLGIAGGLPGKRKRIEAYLESIAEQMNNPVSLSDVDQADYDLVFYPGGHGPMADLAQDKTSGALLVERLAADRPLALLCHAPAAILAAKKEDGSNAFAGRTMTGFSDMEEKLNTFSSKVPWFLETEMKNAGVEYSKALLPLKSHVVRDGNLFSGQNPASAEELATTIVKAMKG